MFYYFLLIPIIIVTIIIVYNYFTAPVLRKTTTKMANDHKISILIPARNEENNIGKCLDSIIEQDYNNFEVIVLDDESTDNTAEIVKSYKENNSNIKCINGKPLPLGWMGKNWACYQLSEAANGDFFLFIDADVKLKKESLTSSIKLIKEKNISMLSIFPSQIIVSWGEWLIVPLMNWLLLSFLPLNLVHASRNESFTAANGQFILIDRKVYNLIGKHKRVADRIVEDMELARAVKSAGFKIKTALGGELVYCRMYNSFSEAFNGFSKNFYAGFNSLPILFILMIITFLLLFTLPYILFFGLPGYQLQYLLIIIIISFGRVLISLKSHQNYKRNIILHPVQMVMMFVVGFKSLIINKQGRLIWKGRKY